MKDTVKELKTEVSALRTAIDKVQVIRGSGGRKPADDAPKNPFDTEEWKKMDPAEKAEILGTMVEKSQTAGAK